MFRDRAKIEFILTMIQEIEEYRERFPSLTEMLDDTMGFNATLMNLLQIGETLNKLKGSYDALDKEDIKGAYDVRNFIAHDYEGVRKSIIESIVREHLPTLKAVLWNILEGE